MLYGLLITLFVFSCILLMLMILIQKGKGSMGLGGLGGGTQLLFGGSGGQELFQKITWILATIFLCGSLILAIMKTSQRAGTYEPEQETQNISQDGPMGNRFPAPAPAAPAQADQP
ncbi:preprotein translocase subunit SecG, partial [Methylicorpusculum sp.]|uniref:preprotein translocase subunit SecG n=1 Tax=Methylicorpusculum sp. TaxID=2713644 RepID=UPI002AB808CD